jgi:hypothetical protein
MNRSAEYEVYSGPLPLQVDGGQWDGAFVTSCMADEYEAAHPQEAWLEPGGGPVPVKLVRV